MRFTLAVFATLFASAMAIPPTNEVFGALEKKCLASGADCTSDVNGCCSGLCSENHGCGCYTCN
ncbi:hypothetical protein GGR57DRAFT_468089 [Xylariaceae sp. FL1272]|nr:hypothetical protein GGR57DRAFT_468089 [Xylariaceae sp. FL1272]